jgi:hypothetical protein
MENIMKTNRINRHKQSESGVALLIAIFVLLLISVIAISLIVASGSESSLAGNYRSSASAFFAGTAGLEEVRGRLLPGNQDYFNNTAAGFIPTAGALAIGDVRYILNPAAGENAASLLTTYPDTEYQKEFGAAPVTSQTIPSVSTVTSGGTTYYGPLFKWVRITAATEKSIGTDVDNNLAFDSTTPLYYDSGHTPQPSLVVTATPPVSAKQALEITALAVLPNGSQRLVQYVVAAQTLNLQFPSALTLSGKSITFAGANSNVYYANGTDGSGNPPAVPGCSPNPSTSLPAIGVTEPLGTSANQTSVIAGIPRQDHYTGAGLPIPSVSNAISLTPSLQTPASLNALVQTISQNGVVITPTPPSPGVAGTATNADLPAMSATNPATVVVNGNLSLSSFVGYGLLVVTGNFSYDGNSGWKGIILVVGSGTTTFTGMGGGNQEFDGAIFVATIKDTNGNLLSQLGTVNFNISGGGGNGVYYNSCWINNAQRPLTYKVLSFRELTQ